MAAIDAKQLKVGSVLPALDGSALTSLPGPSALQSGITTLDGSGSIEVDLAHPASQLIACGAATTVGHIYVTTDGPSAWFINSTSSGVDAGVQVRWIAF